jgi:hypothetical protein
VTVGKGGAKSSGVPIIPERIFVQDAANGGSEPTADVLIFCCTRSLQTPRGAEIPAPHSSKNFGR